MNQKHQYKHIIISRTDSIGDVVLTLPMAGVLKKLYPGCYITFLGKSYTKPVVNLSEHVDKFLDWESLQKLSDKETVSYLHSLKADVFIHVFPNPHIAKLAHKAKIPLRIGTSRRLYHWTRCNKLVNLSRKKSSLHEAQLNLKLIAPLDANNDYSINEIYAYYGFTKLSTLSNNYFSLLDPKRIKIILHPKSKGSAREWNINHYKELIKLLPSDKYQLFVSGTQEEGDLIRDELLADFPQVIDVTGKFMLPEFINFIAACDGIIAASTGPLHIAAALGKIAIGLYPPLKPMHPGRWQPIGKKATYLCLPKSCNDCRKDSSQCSCINAISPKEVIDILENFDSKMGILKE